MESPAKKAKHEVASARGRLPSLLTELAGEVPDRGVLAAIHAPPSADGEGPCGEMHRAAVDKLFAEHVGASPEVVVGNALRVARDEVDREGDIFNKIRTNSYFGDERQKWTNHPQARDLEGPQPDGRVWLSLFLGKGRAEEALAGTVKMNDDGAKDNIYEAVVARLIKEEASQLSTLDLLANILLYAREEAERAERPADLLRFAVVYGLDGVVSDVLRGRYGAAEDLDINTLLPLTTEPIDQEQTRFSFGFAGRAYMPAYAIAAILGHENVVVAALKRLGGEMDAPVGVQRGDGEAVREFATHDLPSTVFLWVFMKNMPGMLKCLVKDCGFQFRWIDHERQLPMVHGRIFDAAEYESFPRWTDLDLEELMWAGGSRARCRLRAGAAYKKQMKMLDLLISLGFPFSLFFDSERLHPLVQREEALIKEKKLETHDQGKAYMRSMDREDRRAREKLYEACCNYNSVQDSDSDDEEDDDDDEGAKKSETLTLGDYYRKLKSRWDSQESVQADRLPEFEELDSRWRKTRRQEREGEEKSESDSYRDSDDGSSYGDPPGAC